MVDLVKLSVVVPEIDRLILLRLDCESLANLAEVSKSHHYMVKQFGRRQKHLPTLLACSREEEIAIPFQAWHKEGFQRINSSQSTHNGNYWFKKISNSIEEEAIDIVYRGVVINPKTLKVSTVEFNTPELFYYPTSFASKRHFAICFRHAGSVQVFTFDMEGSSMGKETSRHSFPCNNFSQARPGSSALAFAEEDTEKNKVDVTIVRLEDDNGLLKIVTHTLEDCNVGIVSQVMTLNELIVVGGFEASVAMFFEGSAVYKKVIPTKFTDDVKILSRGRFVCLSGEISPIFVDLIKGQRLTLPLEGGNFPRPEIAEDLVGNGRFIAVDMISRAFSIFSHEGILLRRAKLHWLGSLDQETKWGWTFCDNVILAFSESSGYKLHSVAAAFDLKFQEEVSVSRWAPNWRGIWGSCVFVADSALALVEELHFDPEESKEDCWRVKKFYWHQDDEEEDEGSRS